MSEIFDKYYKEGLEEGLKKHANPIAIAGARAALPWLGRAGLGALKWLGISAAMAAPSMLMSAGEGKARMAEYAARLAAGQRMGSFGTAGAGIGAAAGLASGLLGEEDKRKSRLARSLQRALLGAALGGIGGVGLGYLMPPSPEAIGKQYDTIKSEAGKRI